MATVSLSHPAAGRDVDSRRALLVALLVSGSFFMENLDGTVIATALPQMADSFHAHPVDLNIGMTAYLLALAIFIPISGWVADRFGARTVFASAIVVFTLSSVACGLSQTLTEFTLARVIQGMGGALMVPVGRLTVLKHTTKKDLMRAIATITWPGLVAPILGPPLGGFITTYLSWHWIFFLNVPLGVFAFGLALILVPNDLGSRASPFDFLGFVLSGVACCSLMYGLELVSRSDPPWFAATFSLIIGTLAAFGMARHVRRHPHPLLDFSGLKVRTFAVNLLGGSFFRVAIGAVPFLLPLLFQVGFHLDAFRSGSLILAVFAGNLSMKPATTFILRRFGFRNTLLFNGAFAAASILACALFSPSTPTVVIVAVLFAGGLFRSMQFTALTTLGFTDIAPDKMSGANTLSSTVMQLTMGLGVAFGAIALRLAALLHPGNPGALTVTDFRIAFCLVGLTSLAGILHTRSLAPAAGAQVSGHRPAKAAPQNIA